MVTEKFRNALEEYHRKKWFPETYPDPFGQFIDYISEGMISDLLESWKRNKIGSQLDAGYYLLRILPQIQYRDLLADYRAALSKRISSMKLQPDFVLFYLRTLPQEQSKLLWNDFRAWSEQWGTVLSDWNSANLEFENQHSEFFKTFCERLNLPLEQELTRIENQLRDTRELFAWRLQEQGRPKSYDEMLRYLNLPRWNNVKDWSDLPSLARSVADTCGIRKVPKLQLSAEPAAQFHFPIAPPRRVDVEYGNASGAVDAMRFLVETGKAFFYKGMNPELKAEERICGDPSLPLFWGNVFGSLLTELSGVKHFIGLNAEGLESDLALASESWDRQEAALALFRRDAMNDRKDPQDHYASRWELAFSMEPPRFLYSYDLSRSTESFFKAAAAHRAKEAVQTFRTKYGSKWFASSQWSKRAKEYFWEGFRLTTQQILRDL